MINKVILMGRLTKDPEIKYTESNLAVARFSVAIDRGKDKEGESKGVDFPNVVVFGKSAENCEKYLNKGRRVIVEGRIQTGSYENKEGNKVYTTDVVANNVVYVDWISKQEEMEAGNDYSNFVEDDEDIPF